ERSMTKPPTRPLWLGGGLSLFPRAGGSRPLGAPISAAIGPGVPECHLAHSDPSTVGPDCSGSVTHAATTTQKAPASGRPARGSQKPGLLCVLGSREGGR